MRKNIILFIIDFILVTTSIVFSLLAMNFNTQFSYAAGFFIGLTTVVMIFTIVSILLSRNKINAEYDERQIVARGKCFQAAFFTLLFCLMVDGLLRFVFDYDWSSYFVGVFTCICPAIIVFCLMAIFMDAYVALEKSLINMGIIMLVIAAINLFSGIREILVDGLIVSGKVELQFANLVAGVTFLIIGISCYIKNFLNKRDMNLE